MLPTRKKATSIASTQYAFTAILDDGSLLSWGYPDFGGITPSIPTRPSRTYSEYWNYPGHQVPKKVISVAPASL